MTSSPVSWSLLTEKLTSGLDLERNEIQGAMREILSGQSDIDSVKSFLLALKAKGETSDEVGALVEVMYANAAPINITERAVDTVGTGGDGAHTINISTTAAIIAASAGARVVKHGNRAASSKSGSGDLLEALGVAITLDGKAVEKTVSELGIGFCFAPIFHPAMRFAAPARKELGIPTVFNILGPLANPAKPQAAAIGVADDRMHLVMAEVLATRGVDGFVFRGDDGLDEITLATTTSVLILEMAKSRAIASMLMILELHMRPSKPLLGETRPRMQKLAERSLRVNEVRHGMRFYSTQQLPLQLLKATSTKIFERD